jgi:glycosyltransferase involved in cell wall biosynthesis
MHRLYFLLYPLGVSALNLSNYDTIISSSSSYAKGVQTPASATHICYCHNPMRWVWRYQDYVKREKMGFAKRAALPILLKGLRAWDINAARQPDQFVANSSAVAERIWEVYRRDAVVIHPPIDLDRFQLSSRQPEHYLILSRLVSYKRLDVAIEACNLLRRPLVIVGDGPDRKRLEAMAGPTVSFVGRRSDAEVEDYVAKAIALLFPGEEDFGMVPLELAAAGKPTVAFGAGGALETIIDGVTGVLFPKQTAASMADAITDLEKHLWLPVTLRNHAQRFDRSVFRHNFLSLLRSSGIKLDSGQKKVIAKAG